MGFEYIAFARMSDDEKNSRMKQRELEFYWKGWDSDKEPIFTHVMHEMY